MVEQYFHTFIHLHGVVLNYSSAGTMVSKYVMARPERSYSEIGK
jgi:hypothetical protein